MAIEAQHIYTAFEDHRQVAKGPLAQVVLSIKKRIGKAENTSVLIFSDETGKAMDFNFQGTEKDVQKRLEVFVGEGDSSLRESTGPGRPKLGVVAREVSLLPRHWEWLASQSGGASATLRKLVEEAKKKSGDGNTVKLAQERTYKFMSALAGDLPGYEEAIRALYKKNEAKFLALTQGWPEDVRHHALVLADPVF